MRKCLPNTHNWITMVGMSVVLSEKKKGFVFKKWLIWFGHLNKCTRVSSWDNQGILIQGVFYAYLAFHHTTYLNIKNFKSWDLMKLIAFHCFHIVKWNQFLVFDSKKWQGGIWQSGATAFTGKFTHCFCSISANINTVKKANIVLEKYLVCVHSLKVFQKLPEICVAQFEQHCIAQNTFLSSRPIYSVVHWTSYRHYYFQNLNWLIMVIWSLVIPFPLSYFSFISYLRYHPYTSHWSQKSRNHSWFFFLLRPLYP